MVQAWFVFLARRRLYVAGSGRKRRLKAAPRLSTFRRAGVATEVGRQGPVGFQVFANTSIGFAISDRDITVRGIGIPADPNEPDSFYFQYDNLRVTGGAGLRLVWYGAR